MVGGVVVVVMVLGGGGGRGRGQAPKRWYVSFAVSLLIRIMTAKRFRSITMPPRKRHKNSPRFALGPNSEYASFLADFLRDMFCLQA